MGCQGRNLYTNFAFGSTRVQRWSGWEGPPCKIPTVRNGQQSTPKNIGVPPHGPYNWSPKRIVGATCTIFQAGAVPGAPGAPRGRKSTENWGQIYHGIFLKVCPIVAATDALIRRSRWEVRHTVAPPVDRNLTGRDGSHPRTCTNPSWLRCSREH
jgi:hypothetical protein